MTRRRAVAGAIAAVGMTGCAVLTVDVDVYKGALANHESVQTEQMAAMAMGAKPLLAELRYRLLVGDCLRRAQAARAKRGSVSTLDVLDEDSREVHDECPSLRRVRDTARSVPETGMPSRDARRVNAILSLYEPADRANTDELLQPLAQALQRLVEQLEKGREIVRPYFAETKPAQTPEPQLRARLLAARAMGTSLASEDAARLKGVPEPAAAQIEAVRTAWQAAIDAWTEAIRLLSSEPHRRLLEQAGGDVLSAVAWIAADLTSPEGVRQLLADTGRPAVLKGRSVDELGQLIPVLTKSGLISKEVQDAVGAVLAQRLADPKTGPALAAELAVAQVYTAARPARDWSVVIYPTAREVLAADESVLVTKDDQAALSSFSSRLGTGLGRGRSQDGLEDLIERYLDANHENAKSSATLRARRQLLDALVNVAEKVTIIANFDVLVRGPEPELGRNPFRSSEREKYVRVLQAVGNSILSQVDALKQVAGHREGLDRARDSEVQAIRNAEARAAAALKQVIAEVLATPTRFPDRALILAAAQTAQQKADDLVTQVTQTLATQRTAWEPEREKAARWVVADEVVLRKTVREAAEKQAGTSMTTADLARRLAAVLGEWEARARLPGGAGEEEARRLRTAGLMLADPAFSQDTGDPGSAATKYLVIVRRMGEQRDGARLRERELAAIVGDLERWHGLASRVSGAGAARLAFPGGVERGAAGSAKDVLDVMLATLRYEHVDAVSRDRNSELAKNRLAAVELLYAYRSGMIHIRPASTYLRNSYPATILQKDPSAGVWQNMLTRHAVRQLPFYDVLTGQSEKALINNTIDKQFWQSVNQVRVAGAGRTNYAVAKDDVGNWYVKSYSADPTDIIKSAKNLAMFSAGPALGANFLAGGGTREAVDATRAIQGGEVPRPAGGSVGDNALTGPTATGPVTGTPGAPVAAQAPRSALQRQFDRVSKRYGDDATKARTKLRDDIQGLNARLKATLQNRGVDDPTLSGLFVAPDAKLMETLGKDTRDDGTPKSAADMNKEMATALRYVKRYRAEVQARLGAIVDPDDPSATPTTKFGKTAGAQAKQDLDAIFKDLLDQAVKERQGSTAQYDSAILFIGETAGF